MDGAQKQHPPMAFSGADHPVSSVHLPAVSPRRMSKLQPIVVMVPAWYLRSGAESLGDVNEDLLVACQTLRLLCVLLYFVDHPWLCTAVGKEKESDIAKADTYPIMQSLVPGPNGEVRTAERIVTHFEVVRGADGESVFGFRFWIVVQDPRLDINTGIESLIVLNSLENARLRKAGKTLPPQTARNIAQAWRYVDSRDTWITRYLGAHTEVDRPDLAVMRPLDEHTPRGPNHIGDAGAEGDDTENTNPANVYDRLGAERTIDMMDAEDRPLVLAAQRRYLPGENGGGGGYFSNAGLRFVRPRDAWHVPWRFATPASMLVCRLPHLGPGLVMDVDGETVLSAARMRAEARLAHAAAVTHGTAAADAGFNSLDRLAVAYKRYVESIDEAYPNLSSFQRRAKVEAAMKSPAGISEFAQAFFGGGACRKINQVAKWIQTHGRKTMMAPPRGRDAIDPALSHFGNFHAWFMRDLEAVYGVKSLHTTVVMMWYVTLTPYQTARNMKPNVVLSGAAAVGKSFVGELLRNNLHPEFTIQTMDRVTKHGFETVSDKLHSAFMSDELDNEILGMDKFCRPVGTGNEIIKAIVSNQQIETREILRGEDGARNEVNCKSRMICNINGNTNSAKNNLPRPIRSRFHVRECVELDRAHHDIQDRKFLDTLNAGCSTHATSADASVDAWYQRLSVLYALLEQMIYTGRIREPSMLVARANILKMCAHLQENGVDTNRETRATERVVSLTRTGVMVNALNIVFNTDLVFPRGKKFEVADMLAVENHMVCSDEMVIFFMQLTFDQYVDVNEPKPIVSTVNALCKYTAGEPAVEGETVFAKDGNAFDYDYLLVRSVFPDPKQGVDHFKAFAMLVWKNMKRGDSSSSLEHLAGVASDLSCSKMMCVPFATINTPVAGIGGNPPAKVSRPILVVNTQENTVRILRQWIDRVVTYEYAALGIDIAKVCEHAHTMPRRIVSGIAYMSPLPAPSPASSTSSTTSQPQEFIMAPHILRCYDLKRDPSKTIRIANPSGYDVSAGTGRQSQPRTFIATECLETTDFVRRARLLCIPPERLERFTDSLPHLVRGRVRGGERGCYPDLVYARYVESERAMRREMKQGAAIDETVSSLSRTVEFIDDGLEAMVRRKCGGERRRDRDREDEEEAEPRRVRPRVAEIVRPHPRDDEWDGGEWDGDEA